MIGVQVTWWPEQPACQLQESRSRDVSCVRQMRGSVTVYSRGMYFKWANNSYSVLKWCIENGVRCETRWNERVPSEVGVRCETRWNERVPLEVGVWCETRWNSTFSGWQVVMRSCGAHYRISEGVHSTAAVSSSVVFADPYTTSARLRGTAKLAL